MATLKISGVWKDAQGVITHYALHTVNEDSTTSRGVKTTKVEAIRIVGSSANQTFTWIWNYDRPGWDNGAEVEVVGGSYLRSYHDGKVSDNLAHLIDYDWLKN